MDSVVAGQNSLFGINNYIYHIVKNIDRKNIEYTKYCDLL